MDRALKVKGNTLISKEKIEKSKSIVVTSTRFSSSQVFLAKGVVAGVKYVFISYEHQTAFLALILQGIPR